MYQAPVGEAFPSETTVVYGAAWGGNWARIGYTKEALTVTYEDERADIHVEEVLAAVKRIRISEAGLMETVLAELTAAYLSFTAGGQGTVSETAAGAAQRAYEQLTLGGQVKLDEVAIGVEGLFISSGGSDFPIRVYMPKCTTVLNGVLEFSKKSDDYTGVPIQAEALADTSNNDRVLVFQRVTAEVT